jgi:hypothetical protein
MAANNQQSILDKIADTAVELLEHAKDEVVAGRHEQARATFDAVSYLTSQAHSIEDHHAFNMQQQALAAEINKEARELR